MMKNKASWKKSSDLAFDMKRKADEAIKVFGKDRVINAVLGVLTDDNGKIIALESVYDCLDKLDRADLASYAPIEGDKAYQEKVIEILFGPYKPKSYIKAIATPGGTGAIRAGITNFIGKGDPLICHDTFWGVYKKMADEFERDFRTYQFLDENYTFNFKAFKEELEKALGDSNRLAIILNSPGNNPTGYSLSNEQWDKLLDLLRKKAEDKDKNLSLIVDVAYLEFAGDGNSQREFFQKFENLPPNLFIEVCFSMSKAYTAYGLRSGAAVGISSDKKAIEDFYLAFAHTARVNWSNTNHGAQKVLVELNKKENLGKYNKDLGMAKALLKKRADIFVSEMAKEKIPMVPYFGGFFAFIPTDKAFDISNLLEKDQIFILPSDKGIRIALCSIATSQIQRLVGSLGKYL
ncbi:MAG: aminotransferase class I/II-fold pyridoxal phosphate-dependent enzyme [Anaerococcus sp.]|nr:aminotransferase class I/II-fold pyridoxal phosphate-dependent enzyme [Anaerococcus sp.]